MSMMYWICVGDTELHNTAPNGTHATTILLHVSQLLYVLFSTLEMATLTRTSIRCNVLLVIDLLSMLTMQGGEIRTINGI